MSPKSEGAGGESPPDRRGAPWQSAVGSGAWSSGDTPQIKPHNQPAPPQQLGVLRPYNPISWFHPKGIHRVLARLKTRLPNVAGCLFLTFTVKPLYFADPEAAFEHSREHLRRLFYSLRKGVQWKGKLFKIDAPYCVKVEFHGNEFAHFHVIFLTRRFLPAELLADLWEFGRTNVARITNEKFEYLLKYVTKDGGELPDWVKSRKRLRVFQSSRGFLLPNLKKAEERPLSGCPKARRPSDTLGERVTRYEHTAVFQAGDKFSHVKLGAPFADIHANEILPAALDGRYLGGGSYKIDQTNQILPWIIPQKSQSQPS